jgi:hypothetical protein
MGRTSQLCGALLRGIRCSDNEGRFRLVSGELKEDEREDDDDEWPSLEVRSLFENGLRPRSPSGIVSPSTPKYD